MIIKTNHQPRFIYSFDSTKPIKLNEAGKFFTYKKKCYNIKDFIPINHKFISQFNGWDAILEQGFFNGLLLKWKNEQEVVIGEYFK